MAQSLDGKIGAKKGPRIMLSNDFCSQFTHKKRAACDVLLTTANTIRLDNPKMNVRLNDKEYGKAVAIIDSHLVLDSKATIFSTASHSHIYYNEGVNSTHALIPNCSYHPISSLAGGLDLKAIIQHLGATGYHDVWVEAGGALFSALHQQRLVDRTYLYLVPTSLGKNGVSAYQQDGLFDREHTVSWQVMADNMILCIDWQGG
jgi:diaminohydroxyphosphoribosylaminopyrimidine deaminase/5-amino-6-(5-phosphoribosylamino)uracil reductase